MGERRQERTSPFAKRGGDISPTFSPTSSLRSNTLTYSKSQSLITMSFLSQSLSSVSLHVDDVEEKQGEGKGKGGGAKTKGRSFLDRPVRMSDLAFSFANAQIVIQRTPATPVGCRP